MRIVKRKEFLALPAGAVFAKGYLLNFSSWQIKGDTCYSDDFYAMQTDYSATDNNDSGELLDQYISMIDHQKEVPLCINSECRDGVFADKDLFLILDNKDIQHLITTLQACITKG